MTLASVINSVAICTISTVGFWVLDGYAKCQGMSDVLKCLSKNEGTHYFDKTTHNYIKVNISSVSNLLELHPYSKQAVSRQPGFRLEDSWSFPVFARL